MSFTLIKSTSGLRECEEQEVNWDTHHDSHQTLYDEDPSPGFEPSSTIDPIDSNGYKATDSSRQSVRSVKEAET